jgi:hypothetical protein
MTAPSRLTQLMRRYLAAVEEWGILDQGWQWQSTRTIRALESLGLVNVEQHGPRWSPGPWRARLTDAGNDMLIALDAGQPAEPTVYRCADCGDGKRLFAWAHANVYGPVGSDGTLDRYDYDETWEDPIEESIACGRHPSGVIEMCVDGVWHRWWRCVKCRGKGYTEYGRYPTYRSNCEATTFEGKHGCWRPVDGDWWDAYQAEWMATVLDRSSWSR